MRFLLLLSIASMGYAMQDTVPTGAINTMADEHRRLLNPPQPNPRQPNERLINQGPIQDARQHCIDHHCGELVLCGACICAGLFGVGCWHAGCVDGIRASRAAILQGVMQ